LIKGVVSLVHGNPWDDWKTGKKITLYSFKIEGDESWYRTGQEKPGFVKGQSISFEVGAKNNVDLDTVTILEAEVKVAPKAASGGDKVRPTSVSRDDYWANKEARDLMKDERYQTVDIPRMTFCTSQDAAVALVVAALQHDCLPKLKADNKAGRLKTVLAYVDELTDRFFKQRMDASTDKEEAPEPEVEVETKEKTLDD